MSLNETYQGQIVKAISTGRLYLTVSPEAAEAWSAVEDLENQLVGAALQHMDYQRAGDLCFIDDDDFTVMGPLEVDPAC